MNQKLKLMPEKVQVRSEYNRFQKWKVLAHSDKIKRIIDGQIPNPVEWIIYAANVCGYKCPHCIMAQEQIDHRAVLSQKAMDKIPHDAMKYGIKTVIFSGGGDPMLNPWTLKTARKLKDFGIRVGINNQGYNLKDPTPFDFVRYSVDAATKETYFNIHRFDGWDVINENIGKLADLRSKGNKIEMGLAFLITPINFGETYKFCVWASQYEPDFIHIRPAYLDADYINLKYPGGGYKMKNEIIPSMKEMALKIESEFKNCFFKIDNFKGFWTPKLYKKCLANPLMAVTSGDGAFLICQDRGIMNSENYLRFGDYNNQTFEEIWWSDDHRKVMNSIDLENCPRCVENSYNEIIENCFLKDSLKMDLL